MHGLNVADWTKMILCRGRWEEREAEQGNKVWGAGRIQRGNEVEKSKSQSDGENETDENSPKMYAALKIHILAKSRWKSTAQELVKRSHLWHFSHAFYVFYILPNILIHGYVPEVFRGAFAQRTLFIFPCPPHSIQLKLYFLSNHSTQG